MEEGVDSPSASVYASKFSKHNNQQVFLESDEFDDRFRPLVHL